MVKKIVSGLMLIVGLGLFGLVFNDVLAAPLLVEFPRAINTGDPGSYIKSIYTWSIGVAGLLAMLMLVVGGIEYTLSAGSVTNRESALGRIKNAVFGLLLLVSIALILTTINPRLINIGLGDIKTRVVDTIKESSKSYTLSALSGFSYSAKTAEKAQLRALFSSLEKLKDDGNVSNDEFIDQLNSFLQKFDAYYQQTSFRLKTKEALAVWWEKKYPLSHTAMDEPVARLENWIGRRKRNDFAALLSRNTFRNIPSVFADKMIQLESEFANLLWPPEPVPTEMPSS